MKRMGWVLTICFLFLTGIAWFLITFFTSSKMLWFPTNGNLEKLPVIVLDPGHGGVDGGTTSISGFLEKNINLAIALNLRDFLTSAGFQVILTRESDISIHNSDASTIKEMKVSDIHNRLQIMKENAGCIFISIHQNHFTESKYSGAQFFYSTNVDSSAVLAECFRNSFRALLQPENNRQTKPCGNEIYLMAHADTTAVLAECGFLSNPTEAELLSDPSYQKKVAFAFFCGILEYCGTNT